MTRLFYFSLTLATFLFNITGDAQKRMVETELNNFFKKYPRSKVVLFLSQNKVIPGDTILFQAGVYNQSGDLIPQRQILQLELIDQKGLIVHRQNVLMATGEVDSYVTIPSSLGEGFYLLRAFTNTMRNQGDLSFAQYLLEVVRERTLQPSPQSSYISLFPEGGQLIGNTDNHLIVRYNGVSLGAPIQIIGSTSGKLGTVFAESSSISSLMVRPKLGEKVHAEHSSGLKSDLTAVTQEGVAVLLREKQGDVRISFPAKSFSWKDLNVMLLGRGQARELLLRSDASDSLVYELPDAPGNGYYQLIVLSNKRNILARRLWAVTSNSPRVLVDLKNKQPGLRSEVGAQVQLKDDRGRPLKGQLNLAVVYRGALNQQQENDRSLLQQFQGNSSVSLQRKNDLNDLELITLREDWLPENWYAADYHPEFTTQPILKFSGTALRMNGNSFRDSTSVMLFLQKKLTGYEAPIINGKFDAPIYFDFDGEDELFYTVHRNDSSISDARIILDRDTVSKQQAPSFKPLLSRDPFADFMVRKKATDRSYRFFNSIAGFMASEQPDPNKSFEDALQGADIAVQIDDYVVFPTLDDVIREIVPSLKHRRTSGRSVVRVFLYSPVLTNTPILSTGDPLYIIDGQMTANTEYFMSMNPAELISIRIVRNVQKLARFGYLGKNGVVLVKTRNPRAIREFKENTVLDVSGLNQRYVYTQNLAQDKRIPDLRILLYWQTAQRTDDQGNYNFAITTGDLAGSFLIRIQGLTEDGRPFSLEYPLEIKEK